MKPLYKQILGDNAKGKKNAIALDKDCEKSFNQMKEICTHTPILAYADYRKPFRVHMDASKCQLGAVLYQRQEYQTLRAIAFVSRSLSNLEKCYHSSKLEFLALKWAIHEQFHEYLYGSIFEVYTDNNPLMYIMTTAKLDATTQRWVAALASYMFKVFYQSGKQNIEADALSCIEWDKEDVAAILEKDCCLESSLPLVPPQSVTAQSIQLDLKPQLTSQEWKNEQRSDPHLGKIIQLLTNKKLLSCKAERTDTQNMRIYLKYKKDLVLKNGLLY